MTGQPAVPEMLDLTGKFCPEVVLCVKAHVETLPSGSALSVISTDPLSEIDIPLFAMRAGIAITHQEREGESIHFRLLLTPADTTPSTKPGDLR
jgi:TusA-related sulfurtransferase